MPSWAVVIAVFAPAVALVRGGYYYLRIIFESDRVVQQKEFWQATIDLLIVALALIALGALGVMAAR